jgi:hypothetical protein
LQDLHIRHRRQTIPRRRRLNSEYGPSRQVYRFWLGFQLCFGDHAPPHAHPLKQALAPCICERISHQAGLV